MKKVLISGAAGFLGSHLMAILKQRFLVKGVDLHIEGLEANANLRLIDAPVDLFRLVEKESADYFVHAAFRNMKRPRETDSAYLAEVLETNETLFETCASIGLPTLLVSSSAVYGQSDNECSLSEESPRNPMSIYGLAKTLQELLAEHNARMRGLKLSIVRLFNLIGPGQAPGMVIPDWLGQIYRIHRGGTPILEIRHQRSWRDFVDVRDASEAIALLIEGFRNGTVVNVASGRATALSEVLEFSRSLCEVSFEVRETESVMNSADIPRQSGDSTKIRCQWGWSPKFAWQDSLLDFWRDLEARTNAQKGDKRILDRGDQSCTS